MPLVKIAPSLLSADFLQLQACLDAIKDADMLHLDIMDGNFVPNISIGPDIVKACKRGSNLPCEVHLMVEKPERFLDAFIDAGSDYLTLHIESTHHIHRAVWEVKEAGVKAGLALNPSTPLSALQNLWYDIDLLLIMTVNPGFGGQEFIKTMLPKIRQARQFIDSQNNEIALAIDGGVNTETVGSVIDAGADLIIAGSAIFRGDIAAGWEPFKKAVAEKRRK